ncbi:MAG: hypothetical protein NT075_27570, partial [Chloroflexi bacterium]|nr:hypothetical protein [Chloroflexota bacterium]
MVFNALRIASDASRLWPFGLLKAMYVSVKSYWTVDLRDSFGRVERLKCRLIVAYVIGKQFLPMLAGVHGAQTKEWPFKFFLRQTRTTPTAYLYSCCASDFEFCRVAASREAAFIFIPPLSAGSDPLGS